MLMQHLTLEQRNNLIELVTSTINVDFMDTRIAELKAVQDVQGFLVDGTEVKFHQGVVALVLGSENVTLFGINLAIKNAENRRNDLTIIKDGVEETITYGSTLTASALTGVELSNVDPLLDANLTIFVRHFRPTIVSLLDRYETLILDLLKPLNILGE